MLHHDDDDDDECWWMWNDDDVDDDFGLQHVVVMIVDDSYAYYYLSYYEWNHGGQWGPMYIEMMLAVATDCDCDDSLLTDGRMLHCYCH